jgi:RNA polymerase sigma-70 factor (ECF subfamily)
MTRTRAGDQTAFDELVPLVRGRAYQLARSWVGNHHDAMELSQDALLRVYKARSKYDPTSPFLPWFHRILRNTCISFLRKRRPHISVRLIGKEDGVDDYELIDENANPVQDAQQAEHAQLYSQAVQSLSQNDREILALRHTQELSYREIAESLGLKEGTVMSRLFHARRRLRLALGPVLGEAPSSQPA